MLKYIAAFDGLKYSHATRKYAVDLTKRANAHLVGIFLDDETYTSYKIYEMITEEGVTEEKVSALEQLDAAQRKAAAQDFEDFCVEQGVICDVHHDKRVALRELIHESIFADLLIIDRKETLTHYEETIPTRFLRDLLTEVHCPVLVVPSTYQPIEKVIMLYDGSASSVYAIRMFSYVCASLKSLPTEILQVEENETRDLKDAGLLQEFIKRHFPTATYQVLQGYPEKVVLEYLEAQNHHTLVVLGAYGRSNFSRWLRPSMADILMNHLSLPLFVANRRT